MPSPSARSPKDILREANDLMTRADWKKAGEVVEEVIRNFSSDSLMLPLVGRAYMTRAQCLVHQAQLEKALEDADKALALAKDTLDLQLEGETLRLIGNICWKKADYKRSLEVLNKALEISKKLKDLHLEGVVHLEIATASSNTTETLTADREYREAILALERVGDLRELARAYNNFANSFMAQDKWDRAAEMFTKCKKIAEKVGDQDMLAWGAFNKAECLVELNQLKEAVQELDLALPVLEKSGDQYGAVGAIQIYGLVFAKMGEWQKAEEYLIKARRMAQKNRMPVSEALIIRDIGRMYKWRGDKEKAVLYLKEAAETFKKHDAKRELARVEKELKGLV